MKRVRPNLEIVRAADYHGEPQYRVVCLDNGEQSQLCSLKECQDTIKLALSGSLLGSFLAGWSKSAQNFALLASV